MGLKILSPSLSHLEKSHAGSLRAARPGPGSAAHSNGACQGLRYLQMGPSLLRTHQKYQSLSRVQLFVPPWTTRLLCSWDSPGKNTGVGCPFPFQGIFPTQGSNLHLLLCRQILYLWDSLPGKSEEPRWIPK